MPKTRKPVKTVRRAKSQAVGKKSKPRRSY